jgi:hypothetical protein
VRVDRRRARGLDLGPWKALESPPRPVLVDLRGRCFNCFSSEQRAVECCNRVRCFLYRLPGHHVNVCPHRRVAPSLSKCSLVWRPVSKETSEVRLGMVGGSMVGVVAAGDGMKKRTRRGQRKQKAGARRRLGLGVGWVIMARLELGKKPVTRNLNPEYPNPNPKYPKPEFCSGISGSNMQNPNLFRVIRVSKSGTRITQTFMCHVLMSCLIINLYIYNYV